ncbi:hypothetical protein [Microbulbifer sp. TB1203]|uniref:hypothetical protein n=1 Tax=Microbulbifer sp. TB1203 TaxID=3021712 RepID=UPI0027E57A5C|nr:hypothetical protein [Microbulbifer sp. TB1203]
MAIESELSAFLSYADISLQNTITEELFEKFGTVEVFDPPGEYLHPKEVCYSDKEDIEVTFFIEDYTSNRRLPDSRRVVSGLLIRNLSFEKKPAESNQPKAICRKPSTPLPRCIGSICIDDKFNKAVTAFKTVDSADIDLWDIKITNGNVKVSRDDLAIKQCCEGRRDDFNKYVFPSHEIRIHKGSDGSVETIYVNLDLEFI